MLGQLEGEGKVVVADFEAGLGTLSRLEANQLDVILVVTEPSAKAVEVAVRAFEMIRSRGLGRAILVANRICSPDDAVAIDRTFSGAVRLLVPDDPAIRAADARGAAPFDAAAESPAIRLLTELSRSLPG